MKTITFYESKRRDANTLHIETDGCIVNIQVGLTDADGRKVTRVDVSPMDESRGGDGLGYVWHQDGPRIIRQHPPKQEGYCQHDGEYIERAGDGPWLATGVRTGEDQILCDKSPDQRHHP